MDTSEILFAPSTRLISFESQPKKVDFVVVLVAVAVFVGIIFSRGTRAQHLTLCGVRLVSPVRVVSGVPWMDAMQRRKDNCTVGRIIKVKFP